MESASDRVGTLRWAQRTGGILDRRDRARLFAQGVRVQVESAAARLRRLFGAGGPLAALDIDEIRLPDSAMSKEAEALSRAATPPAIVNHAFRSYAWGAMLAAHDRLSYDEELFYVACLLHDVGFVEDRDRAGGRCFTLVGAEAALNLEGDSPWLAFRREAAAEAITMHLNLRVPLEAGPEAYLLFAGSRLDAVGYRNWDLDSPARDRVLERYPRAQMKDSFARTMTAQAQMSPGSRSHLYTRYLAGNRFICRAPFPE